MMPRVSVVIPTYRRPFLLDRCLEALLEQDLAPGSFEICVADDGADVKTRGVVERRARETPNGPLIRYLPVTGNHGPAAARNHGWRAAHAPIIAFTDDDCVPMPSWLRQGLAGIDAGAEAASGRLVMPLPSQPTDYERDAARLARADFVTANCFCRREALQRVGGFDEAFTAAFREDSDLYFTLIEGGYRIVQAKEAVVAHPIRPAPWGTSLRQQRKIVFDALLYKKHRALYRARIRATPRWDYYAITSLALVFLGSVASSAAVPAIFAGVGWVALTAELCRARLRDTVHAPGHVVEMIFTSGLIPPLAVFWRLVGAVKFRVAFF